MCLAGVMHLEFETCNPKKRGQLHESALAQLGRPGDTIGTLIRRAERQ